MKRLPFAMLLPLLWAVASSCANPVSSGPVEIRVENASAAVMEAVRVAFPDEWQEYGTLAPGEASGYRTVALAYRIATVEATVGGELHRLQVIDFVGETPLSGGRYTYRLDLFEGASLTLELVRD
jgi:hypothetical protein